MERFSLVRITMRFSRLHSVTVTIFVIASGWTARPAVGQLISPGELSVPHAELEGLRACTNCHELRAKGVEGTLCLDCHTALRARIEAGRGYHPGTNAADNCARCHKEHFGRDFDLLHFDSLGFEHSETGWSPEGAHEELECRECHKSSLVRSREVRIFKGRYGALDRTYLGLDTECISCHQADDPHGSQFADRTCESCHGQETWDDPPGFDHDATRYALTGLHARVACADCHPPVRGGSAASGAELRFTGLQFGQCTACHEDAHDGGMGAACSSCHATRGWDRVGEETLRRRFDHESVYRLEGAHGEAECGACHSATSSGTEALQIRYRPGTEGKSYPSPLSEGCVSCHRDEHGGELAESSGGSACDRCHGQDEWIPARYDFRRHNEEASFVLQGAHVAVPCLDCHPDPEPSGASPGRFRMGLGGSCADCHAPADPHAGQFEDRSCDACHGDRTFRIPGFDHDRTRYPLDGAHREVACAACHSEEAGPGGLRFTRYRPLGSECTDCHGGSA
jgi:hypothetical protein